MPAAHDIVLIPVSGDLCAATVPALRQTVSTLLGRGCRRVVLNMADVSRVDSAGMSFLIMVIRRMREEGGLVSLVNVSPPVMHALKIARLVEVIPVSAAGERRDVPALDPKVQPLWRRTIPVDGSDLHAARARVGELASTMGFPEDDVFDLTLAVGEALGNAADHTCGDGILATMSAYPDRLVVEVDDCGCGFDARGMRECEDRQAGKERGRGIQLMRLLVDSVEVVPRAGGTGTVARLVKLTPRG